MKIKLLKGALSIAALLLFGLNRVNAQELQFQYDPAGNQTERKFVCVNCSTFPVSLATPDLTQTVNISSEEENTASTKRKLVAYPNPLTETLFLKWSAPNGLYLKTVEVFTTSGVRFFNQSYQKRDSSSELSVSFSRQTPGLYVVRATYSDGQQENVKVIKKQ